MANNATYVLLRTGPSEPLRKITKIVPYPNGGFAVLMPYHSARKGWLLKLAVDYNRRGTMDVLAVADYDANDRVKLSYHADGFAQFSGENPGKIVSGRDELGNPKGLGVVTGNPISNPIRTGPTFGVQIWGPSDFAAAEKSTDTDIVFEERDLYHRACTPGDANAYMIEGFLFPEQMWAAVRRRYEGGYSLHLAHPSFEATNGVLEWRVVELPGQAAFIGLCASRLRVGFKPPSGFVLGGPGSRDQEGRGEVLNAIYPPQGPEPRTSNLDRSI
jgi:hypothetical protein